MKKILLVILIAINSNCIVKNNTHSGFWEHFFTNQHLLQDKYKGSHLYQALFGQIRVSDENTLYKKDSLLYISGRVYTDKDKKIAEIGELFLPQGNEEYFIRTEITKSSYNERDTYQIKRISEMKYPAYFTSDYFHYLEELSIQLNSEEGSESLDKSVLYKFLCSNFDCDLSRDANRAVLSLTPNKKMAVKYKSSYEKINSYLKRLKLKIKMYRNSQKIGEVNIVDKIIYFNLMNLRKGDLKGSAKYYFSIDMEINFFGMKIKIEDLEHTVDIKQEQNKETIRGEYSAYPKVEVSGKLFYFLPPGILNIFIPQDLDSYFKDFFDLTVKSQERAGTYYVTQMLRLSGGEVRVIHENHSEVFRNPFRPFASEKNETKLEGGDFYRDLQQKIIEDLHL